MSYRRIHCYSVRAFNRTGLHLPSIDSSSKIQQWLPQEEVDLDVEEEIEVGVDVDLEEVVRRTRRKNGKFYR